MRPAIVLLALALALVACVDVQSPTEPSVVRSRTTSNTNCPIEQKDMYGFCIPQPVMPPTVLFTLTPKADACAFVVWSEPAIQEPARLTAYADGIQRFDIPMTTQGHTAGIANFTGRYELAVVYHGLETRAAMECGK